MDYVKDLCDTCRLGLEGICYPPTLLQEVFKCVVVECSSYRTIAHREEVDEGGRTYRCSFCGKLITSKTKKCPECGAEYGR